MSHSLICGLLVLYIPVSFRLNKVGLTPWIKAFHQGQEKKATAIALVTASEPADGTNPSSIGGCFRGTLYVVGYGSLGSVVVRAGRGSCLERHTIEGDSPAPCLLLPHVLLSGTPRVWLFGIAASSGKVYLFEVHQNIRMGPTVHK